MLNIRKSQHARQSLKTPTSSQLRYSWCSIRQALSVTLDSPADRSLACRRCHRHLRVIARAGRRLANLRVEGHLAGGSDDVFGAASQLSASRWRHCPASRDRVAHGYSSSAAVCRTPDGPPSSRPVIFCRLIIAPSSGDSCRQCPWSSARRPRSSSGVRQARRDPDPRPGLFAPSCRPSLCSNCFAFVETAGSLTQMAAAFDATGGCLSATDPSAVPGDGGNWAAKRQGARDWRSSWRILRPAHRIVDENATSRHGLPAGLPHRDDAATYSAPASALRPGPSLSWLRHAAANERYSADRSRAGWR